MQNKEFKVLGLMSGTSLDGLDLAICHFKQKEGKWTYSISDACTVPYTKDMQKKLSQIENSTAMELCQFDAMLATAWAKEIKAFLGRRKVDMISSHGHTIFHQPAKGFTTQIGSGAHLAALTGITTVCDFRSLDVALNGQGAPLVPIGDELLFGEYGYCLNIGGIANISFKKGKKRIAYDICPANMVFNYLANIIDLPYDKGGAIARTGKVIPPLLKKLSGLSYYQESQPKSLGKEWVKKHVWPILDTSKFTINDLLRTAVEHSAFKIAEVLTKKNAHCLITGGGAYNDLLLELIRENTQVKLVVPDKRIVEFKEALIFGFLGVLRFTGEINTLKTVTGASRDSVGGAIYLGR